MSTERCNVCGRFCVPFDSSTPFGGPADLEPPDDEIYCEPCTRKLKKEAIEGRHVFSNWSPARWEREVAAELGMVRAGPKGCAWAEFFLPENIPDGWLEVG